MKLLLTTLSLFFLSPSQCLLQSAVASSSSPSLCGQTKVPTQDSICIQPNYIEGCRQYSTPTTCNKCQLGYKNKQGLCHVEEFVPHGVKIEGCLEKNYDDSFCVNCANGFVRRNGKCEKGVKNCGKYGANGCEQCQDGYALVMGQCRYNIILGCKKISNHSCQQCYQPFILSNSHCELPNCQSLNDYGCTTCQCGFYLTPTHTCKKSQDGCLRYERGRCINCLNHYRLKGGQCLIQGCAEYDEGIGKSCKKCKQQYENVGGGCQFKNCVDWVNDACYACKHGWRVEGGICVQEDGFVCQA